MRAPKTEQIEAELIKAELIRCHDCGSAISFSASSCPRCGSLEPRGPYVHSRREQRLHRIEERNDRNLMMSVLGCGALGALFGAITALSPFGAVVAGIAYGCLGVLLGVPVGFVINMTRHLGRPD
jgi:hypothetical protein